MQRRQWVAVSEAGRLIGEHHPQAKLADADIDRIHEMRADGMSLQSIGDFYGVKKAAIWKVLHGHRRCQLPARWVNVPVREPSEPSKRKGRSSSPKPSASPPSGNPAPSPGAELQNLISRAWR